MNSLLTDRFRRGLVQVMVGIIFAAISIVSPILLVLLAVQALQGLQDYWQLFGALFINALGYPADNQLAQVFVAAVAAFPTVVAIVCFGINKTATPWTNSTDLNWLGRGAIIGLLIGALASLLVILIFNTSFDLVKQIAHDDKITAAVGPVVTGILAFQAVYILKLLGIDSGKKG
jgi:hypothetical protein